MPSIDKGGSHELINLALQELGSKPTFGQIRTLLRGLRKDGISISEYHDAPESLVVRLAQLLGYEEAKLQFHIDPVGLPQAHSIDVSDACVYVRIARGVKMEPASGLHTSGRGTSIQEAFANACVKSFGKIFPGVCENIVIESIYIFGVERLRVTIKLCHSDLGQCTTVGHHKDIFAAIYLALVDAVRYLHIKHAKGS
jgi:hypothetical protein